MAQSFFTYQSDLTDPANYGYVSPEHFLALGILATVMLLLALWFYKMGARSAGRRRFLRAVPIFMFCTEIFKQSILAIEGHSSIGMLPLHLCGLGAYEFLLAEYLPWGKAKPFFGEIALILFMPGAIAALALPDWTMYPLWNYYSIHGYLWHGLLVLYPCLLLMDHEIEPHISHLWYEIIFLAVIVPPIYIFNKVNDTNYFFINWPIDGTPLEWLASFMGNPGYLIGYALLAAAVMCLMYVPSVVAGNLAKIGDN